MGRELYKKIILWNVDGKFYKFLFKPYFLNFIGNHVDNNTMNKYSHIRGHAEGLKKLKKVEAKIKQDINNIMNR